MRYIHFIVNPISGKGRHVLTEAYIRGFFPASNYRVEVHTTTHKGHAIELAQNAKALNADIIVSCGGDGTINEVASCIVGTGIRLGIIPVGSGNGLASNLGIPADMEDAIGVIRRAKTGDIDAGKINDNYFFSNMGFGIDAMIIKHYENSGRRTLLSYIFAALSASNKFKATVATITHDNATVQLRPFLLFASNSNEMGYKMSLTPNASLTDGLLNLLIVPELRFWEKIRLGYYVLCKRTERFKKASHALVGKVHIVLPEKIFTDVQIDGEYHYIKTNVFDITVLPGALKVIIP